MVRPGFGSRLAALLRPDDGRSVNSFPHMRDAGAGWYYDPFDESVYRFWDGRRWTDRRSDHFPSADTV